MSTLLRMKSQTPIKDALQAIVDAEKAPIQSTLDAKQLLRQLAVKARAALKDLDGQ